MPHLRLHFIRQYSRTSKPDLPCPWVYEGNERLVVSSGERNPIQVVRKKNPVPISEADHKLRHNWRSSILAVQIEPMGGPATYTSRNLNFSSHLINESPVTNVPYGTQLGLFWASVKAKFDRSHAPLERAPTND